MKIELALALKQRETVLELTASKRRYNEGMDRLARRIVDLADISGISIEEEAKKILKDNEGRPIAQQVDNDLFMRIREIYHSRSS